MQTTRPAPLPTWLPHLHVHWHHTPGTHQAARPPTRTCFSSLPHLRKQPRNYSSCSGQKPWCHPWLRSFFHSTSSSVQSITSAPLEMRPESSHFSSPPLPLSPCLTQVTDRILQYLPASTFAPTLHPVLYITEFCPLKICQIQTLCAKPSGGFPPPSELLTAMYPGWERCLPSRRCSVNTLIRMWKNNGQSHRARTTPISQQSSVKSKARL